MSGEEDVPRRWQRLDAEQRAVADELVRRALELRETSEGELSSREALNLAAAAIERRTRSASRSNAASTLTVADLPQSQPAVPIN